MKWVFLILFFLNLVLFVTGYTGLQEPVDAQERIPEQLQLKLLRELSDAERESIVRQAKAQLKALEVKRLAEQQRDILQAGEQVLNTMLLGEQERLQSTTEYVDALSGYQCRTLGPIANLEQAEQIARWVVKYDAQAIARKNIRQKHLGFWVVLPKLQSMSRAKKKLENLKASGIRDAYMFTKGELKMSISLGLFNRRDHAEVRQKELREKYAVEASVEPRIKDESDYWVDYKLRGGGLPKKLKGKIATESKKIRYSKWRCLVVAS